MGPDRVHLWGGRRRFAALVGLNVIYAGLLVVLAVMPRVPGAIDAPDRIMHACAYGIQSLLIFVLLSRSMSIGLALTTSWFLATSFGGFTEWLQLLQPSRSSEIMDVVADASGAFVTCALIAVCHWVRGKDGGSR